VVDRAAAGAAAALATGVAGVALAGGAGFFGKYSAPGWPQPASMVAAMTTGNTKYNGKCSAKDDFTIRITV
jgi:hypothetical protein